MEQKTEKNRYSDEELLEFKNVILEKLEAARTEFKYYQDQLMNANV